MGSGASTQDMTQIQGAIANASEPELQEFVKRLSADSQQLLHLAMSAVESQAPKVMQVYI